MSCPVNAILRGASTSPPAKLHVQASCYDSVLTSSALNAAAVDYNSVLTSATRDTAVDYNSVLTTADGGGVDYDMSASTGAETAVILRSARPHGSTARGASGGGLGQRASTYDGFDAVVNGVTTADYTSTLTTASTTGGGGTDYDGVLTEAPVRCLWSRASPREQAWRHATTGGGGGGAQFSLFDRQSKHGPTGVLL